jgi:putative nucleotidyltransferase with HDIG domain
VPLDKKRVENISELTKKIVENVNSLPLFPENIIAIQRLIDDPKSDLSDIAKMISIDPAMTADILKIMNSAQYMLLKHCDNVTDAVKLLGIKGVKNLLYSYGTQKILGEENDEKKALWVHSYKTAFFAYNMVKNFKRDQNLLEDVYIGGILHDMGKMVFANVHPDMLEKIRGFCEEKNVPFTVFERITAGMNHAEIGALLAEKWNFPETLVSMIRYHHSPQEAPCHKELAEAVYLADILARAENGVAAFDQIDKVTLANYGLSSKSQISTIVQKLSEGFEKERAFR